MNTERFLELLRGNKIVIRGYMQPASYCQVVRIEIFSAVASIIYRISITMKLMRTASTSSVDVDDLLWEKVPVASWLALWNDQSCESDDAVFVMKVDRDGHREPMPVGCSRWMQLHTAALSELTWLPAHLSQTPHHGDDLDRNIRRCNDIRRIRERLYRFIEALNEEAEEKFGLTT